MRPLIYKACVSLSLLSLLGGCAASKMFMAGYKPPQTIADLLREQGKLPHQSGSNGVQGSSDLGTSAQISLESYQGEKVIERNREPRRPTDTQVVNTWHNSHDSFRPSFSHKSIQDYAAQLSMQLLENGNGLNESALIGVSSFVILDESMNTSTILGNQLSEYFITEIQQLGLSVIDFKTQAKVQVTRSGDFVFSRDAQRLAKSMTMDHVLTGTLIEKPKGMQINARIISLQSNQIKSSASILIPHFVTQQLYSNNYSF